MKPCSDRNATWWPVLAVSFHNEQAVQWDVDHDHWGDDEEDGWGPVVVWEDETAVMEEGARVVYRTRVLWICCQEQLQWEVPEAWAFPLRCRM